MPADIVNLRLARKRRRRGAAERDADANRVRHGTPKALRDEARAERARALSTLNGLKLDRAAPADTEPSVPVRSIPDETGKPS